MNNQKNIIHIITELSLGGAQKSTLYLIKYLQEQNLYSHTIISSVPANKSSSFLSNFMQIKDLQILLLHSLKRTINPILDIFCLFKLILTIKKISPDIVHTHSSKAGLLGRIAAYLCKTEKIIHTVHGFPFHGYQNIFIKHIYILLERFCALLSTHIIFISQADLQKAKELKIGNNKKNILIRDFIELNPFKEIYKTKNSSISNELITIGTLSCLKKQKGLKYLFTALKILKDKGLNIKLLIAGDGTEKQNLKKLAKSLNIKERISFLGWQKNTDKLFYDFDIFVLSSLWEGLPIAIAESMAAGTPVVAPRINGIPEIITDNETGMLFKATDCKELADKIQLIINDKNLYEKLRKKAYNSIIENKEFSLTRLTNEIKGIYNA